MSYQMTWKTGFREDILRRKPPDACKLALIVFTWILVVQYTNGISCKLYEVQQRNFWGGYHCIKCPVCPPGQGLHPQCLRFLKLNLNTSMKCVPCKTGTFSNKNDTASCQACQQCDGHKTLRNCTAAENTQCSRECRDGFQLDDSIYSMCVRKPFPQNILISSQKPMTTHSTEALTRTSTITTIINSGKNNTTADRKWIAPIILGLVCFIFITIILGVIGLKKREDIRRWICRVYCACKGGSSTDQENPELNETSLRLMNPGEKQEVEESPSSISVPPNQQEKGLGKVSSGSSLQQRENLEKSKPVHYPVNPDLAGQLLKDVSHELMMDIALKISKKDQVKGWREIGEICQVPKKKLEQMETKSSWAYGGMVPGELLLEYIGSSKPELTLKGFIEMLKTLKREDVIFLIQEELSKISITVS